VISIIYQFRAFKNSPCCRDCGLLSCVFYFLFNLNRYETPAIPGSVKAFCCGVVIASLLFLASCSLHRFPGGSDSFCIEQQWSKEYEETVKYASFSTGQYVNRKLHGVKCGITELGDLHVHWETKKGVKREEYLDLKLLVDKMKNEQRPEGGFAEAELVHVIIGIINENIEITYYIYHQSVRDMRLFTRRYNYLLYSSERNYE
jgi:hypothetical protein